MAKKRVTIESALTHPMSRLEFYRLVAPLVADLNDEHTLLSPPGEEIGMLMSSGLQFPVCPIIRGDRTFVRANYSSNANLRPGSEILAINGTNNRELLDRLCPFAIGKNREHRLALVEKFFGILLWIGEGYGPPFNVRVGRNGKPHYTPQSQLRTFTASTAMPVPAATPASAFFAPGSPVGKAVAADHDRHQTCNLCNGACEKALDSGKAGVER